MHDDFREFIESLVSKKVEFVVVGAHALAFYGRPRYTEDIDIFLRKTSENQDRLSEALRAFGVPVTHQALDRLFKSDREMIVLGVEPNAIDLMNFLDGVSFEEVWEGKSIGQVVGVEAPIIGVSEYRKTKKFCGRPKDMADLALLNEVIGESSD